jgi:hypothetical protein
MNLFNFLPAFFGVLTGISVYHLLIRPLSIKIYTRLKAKREACRVDKEELRYKKGKEFAWSAWGTHQLSFNALAGSGFSSTTPFGKGMSEALKDIWPFELERRLNDALEKRISDAKLTK